LCVFASALLFGVSLDTNTHARSAVFSNKHPSIFLVAAHVLHWNPELLMLAPMSTADVP